MQYSFEIETTKDASMTERLARIIRVRGFVIDKMNAEAFNLSINYEFVVSGERSIDNLLRQLEKIVGVRSCTSNPAHPGRLRG